MSGNWKSQYGRRGSFWKWHLWKSIGFGPRPKQHAYEISNRNSKATSSYALETMLCALCLATSLHSPTARAGSPTKAQPCVPLISTMHGQPFLIALLLFKAKLKLESGNREIQYGCQVAMLKINKLLLIVTNNAQMKFEIEIPKQTWVMLRETMSSIDGRTDGRADNVN